MKAKKYNIKYVRLEVLVPYVSHHAERIKKEHNLPLYKQYILQAASRLNDFIGISLSWVDVALGVGSHPISVV